MYIDINEIAEKADNLVNSCGTHDPRKIARELDIEIIPCTFKAQKGAYKVILKNPFIFLKNDLHPVTEKIVLLHEIGHDRLHRSEAVQSGGFKEFNIFDMQDLRMEYEANIFAAQISLPDSDVLELIEKGLDIQQITCAMHSDINLVALKTDILISKGFSLHRQPHENRFLKAE